MTRRTPTSHHRLAAVGVAMPAIAGCVILAAGLTAPAAATSLGSVGIALSLLFSGGVLIRQAKNSGSRGMGRGWFGIAIAMSGPMLALDVGARTVSSVFSLGWAALAAVFLVAVLQGVKDSCVQANPRYEVARSVAEAVAIGALLALAMWRWVFYDVLARPLSMHDLTALLFTSACAASILVLASGQRNSRVRLVFLAAIVLCLAELAVLRLSVTESPLWPALVAYAAGSSLMVWGLATYRLGPPDATDSRLTTSGQRVILGSLTVGLLVINVLTLTDYQGMDSLTWSLVALAMLSLWAREIVRSRQANLNAALLYHEATTDALTGLGNRRALGLHLETLARNHAGAVSVVTVDLNGFKGVNDLLGTAVGDELLIGVAHELRHAAEQVYTQVFRINGNEYLAVSQAGDEVAERFARRIPALVARAAASVNGVDKVLLSCSAGVEHLGGPDGLTSASLTAGIARSGLAMRAAKADGRDKVVIFNEDLAKKNQRRLVVEARLRDLLDGGGCVEVHYQPMMGMRTGRMVGAEALARWTDPELGSVPPFEFIPVAEDTGLIEVLGDRILRTALTELSQSGFFARGLRVSINVSTLQLRVAGFAGNVLRLLREFEIAPAQVELEVTESVFVSPGDPAAIALTELQRIGVGVSVDDFGTGYSSLGYLHRLPVTTLKIDRSLCATLVDLRTQSIVRGVVEMTRGLGLDVVLEGVESTDQEHFAQTLGVGYAQGWLYAKAAPISELITLADQLECASQAVRTSAGIGSPTRGSTEVGVG